MKRLLDTLSHLRLLAALTFAAFAAYFFLYPGLSLATDLTDPALAGPGIPERARSMHRTLSPQIEAWARDRVATGRAAQAALHDVPTTEWPIFTAVFYLLATEELQADWERDPDSEGPAPVVYAAETIEAARDLIIDPSHHTWVRTHWGDDYMHQENVFFRALVIAGLTSHEALMHDGTSVPMLRDQVSTLAADLDASPLGVLDDYPGECYPIDVVVAIGWIQRADAVLGTDHSAFIARSLRGFEGTMADSNGLVPFRIDLPSGAQSYGPARGIGNSWVSVYAPDLWPGRAAEWYAAYERHYWQDNGWSAGFREFLPGVQDEWTFEIDAGPVLDGLGTSANAFGLAAARRNGRLDHAYTLSSQLAAASWTLPGGTLALPRLISHGAEAPYLGEAAIMFFLTVPPAEGVPIVTGGETPGLVYFGFVVYFGVSGSAFLMAFASARRWRRRRRAQADTRTDEAAAEAEEEPLLVPAEI